MCRHWKCGAMSWKIMLLSSFLPTRLRSSCVWWGRQRNEYAALCWRLAAQLWALQMSVWRAGGAHDQQSATLSGWNVGYQYDRQYIIIRLATALHTSQFWRPWNWCLLWCCSMAHKIWVTWHDVRKIEWIRSIVSHSQGISCSPS